MTPWAPRNGASLAYVAAKRGWPMVTLGLVTVAVADTGNIYYDGALSDAAALLRRLV